MDNQNPEQVLARYLDACEDGWADAHAENILRCLAAKGWEFSQAATPSKGAGTDRYHCPFCSSLLTLKIDGDKYMACESADCAISHLDLNLQYLRPTPEDKWEAGI